MVDMLTRFTRVEIVGLRFAPAPPVQAMTFARHKFAARIRYKTTDCVLCMYVTRDLKISETTLVTDAEVEKINPADVPFGLIDLAITMALGHSSQFVIDTFYRS
jgi:hypothetical protein